MYPEQEENFTESDNDSGLNLTEPFVLDFEFEVSSILDKHQGICAEDRNHLNIFAYRQRMISDSSIESVNTWSSCGTEDETEEDDVDQITSAKRKYENLNEGRDETENTQNHDNKRAKLSVEATNEHHVDEGALNEDDFFNNNFFNLSIRKFEDREELTEDDKNPRK